MNLRGLQIFQTFVVAFFVSSFSYAVFAQEEGEYKTNSGETFKDPFADVPETAAPAVEPEPVLDDESTSDIIVIEPESEIEEEFESSPEERSFDEQSSEEPEAPRPSEFSQPVPPAAAPSITSEPEPKEVEIIETIETIEEPSIDSSPAESFSFPEEEANEGPVSQDFLAKEVFSKGTPVDTWNFELGLGAAANMNRRPSQVNFDFEGGYRLWKGFELNGLVNARFITDKVFGLYVMPSYAFRLTGRSTRRIDLRVATGTGWVLRSTSGASFQRGYLPWRSSVAAIFYGVFDFALVFAIDTELWLYRINSGGGSFNELSSRRGAPAQALATVGIRWEFD